MGDTTQEDKRDWEDEGGATAPEPMQKTAKGLEIPVPPRESIFAAFKKIVQPIKKDR